MDYKILHQLTKVWIEKNAPGEYKNHSLDEIPRSVFEGAGEQNHEKLEEYDKLLQEFYDAKAEHEHVDLRDIDFQEKQPISEEELEELYNNGNKVSRNYFFEKYLNSKKQIELFPILKNPEEYNNLVLRGKEKWREYVESGEYNLNIDPQEKPRIIWSKEENQFVRAEDPSEGFLMNPYYDEDYGVPGAIAGVVNPIEHWNIEESEVLKFNEEYTENGKHPYKNMEIDEVLRELQEKYAKDLLNSKFSRHPWDNDKHFGGDTWKVGDSANGEVIITDISEYKPNLQNEAIPFSVAAYPSDEDDAEPLIIGEEFDVENAIKFAKDYIELNPKEQKEVPKEGPKQYPFPDDVFKQFEKGLGPHEVANEFGLGNDPDYFKDLYKEWKEKIEKSHIEWAEKHGYQKVEPGSCVVQSEAHLEGLHHGLNEVELYALNSIMRQFLATPEGSFNYKINKQLQDKISKWTPKQ